MLEYSTSLKTKTEQCIRIHMFTYWHVRNLRGSVLSKIPLGCFAQREPTTDRPPWGFMCVCVSVCVSVCVCVWIRLGEKPDKCVFGGVSLTCINTCEEINMLDAGCTWQGPVLTFSDSCEFVFLLLVTRWFRPPCLLRHLFTHCTLRPQHLCLPRIQVSIRGSSKTFWLHVFVLEGLRRNLSTDFHEICWKAGDMAKNWKYLVQIQP